MKRKALFRKCLAMTAATAVTLSPAATALTAFSIYAEVLDEGLGAEEEVEVSETVVEEIETTQDVPEEELPEWEVLDDAEGQELLDGGDVLETEAPMIVGDDDTEILTYAFVDYESGKVVDVVDYKIWEVYERAFDENNIGEFYKSEQWVYFAIPDGYTFFRDLRCSMRDTLVRGERNYDDWPSAQVGNEVTKIPYDHYQDYDDLRMETVTLVYNTTPFSGLYLYPVAEDTIVKKVDVQMLVYDFSFGEDSTTMLLGIRDQALLRQNLPQGYMVIATNEWCGIDPETRELSVWVIPTEEVPAEEPPVEETPTEETPAEEPPTEDTTTQQTNSMHRLYNLNTGEHLYTSDEVELADVRDRLQWLYEGISWTAPETGDTAIVRLYNPDPAYSEHHYTADQTEINYLVDHGWLNEGIKWYSNEGSGEAVHRLFNPDPTQPSAASHHYTKDQNEIDYLVAHGWIYEGVAWYGVN